MSNNNTSNGQVSSQRNFDKNENRIFCVVLISIAVCVLVIGIRHFTAVTPDQYYWPCNISGIVPSTDIWILEEETTAYGIIITKYEQSTIKDQFSAEIENIKAKKKDIEEKINLQNCYRQKCAKININNNLEEIKEKALTNSTWLFRCGAILFLCNGFLCYYKRQIIDFGFCAFVFLVVVPFIINAYLSMGDFFDIQNFKVNC